MDSRAALKASTTLRFNDGWEYTITDELARGGSSIVYNAYYIDNLLIFCTGTHLHSVGNLFLNHNSYAV